MKPFGQTLRFGPNKLVTSLRVLTYWDDSENACVALALEMDLRGYGDTPELAMKELYELVEVQIGFAIQKKDLTSLNFPAEPMFFEMFEKAQNQGSQVRPPRQSPLPPPQVFHPDRLNKVLI